MPIRICQGIEIISPIPDEQNVLNIYLDLSKQVSGIGTLINPYSWWDILNIIKTQIDGGTKLTIYTLGSNNALLSDLDKLVLENRTFAKSLGQHITFVAYRPYEWNIPFMSYAIEQFSTVPFIKLKDISGLTLKFKGFRISPKFETFLELEDCSNCDIQFIRNGIYPHGNSSEDASSSSSSASGGPASFMEVKDCSSLNVSFLFNTITDLSDSDPLSGSSIIKETHSIFSDVNLSGRFDSGIDLDNGRTFDTGLQSNTFYFSANYVSYNNGIYTLFDTDNYITLIYRGWNRYNGILSPYVVPDIYSNFATTIDEGQVNGTHLIDEFDFEKDLRPLYTSTIVDYILPFNIKNFLSHIDESEYTIDVMGRDSSSLLTWSAGAYEIEALHALVNLVRIEEQRYVDMFPVNTPYGNDGYTNILLHLDQDPIIDRSSNEYTPIPDRVQIRQNQSVFVNDWNLSCPCDIDLSEGVTFDFWFYSDVISGELGYLGFPITIQKSTGKVNLTINGEVIQIGNTAAWYHLAIEYFNNELFVFSGGTLILNTTFTDITSFVSDLIVIGSYSGASLGGEFNIKEFRVSNTLRWDSDFTPNFRSTHYEDIGKLGSFLNPMSEYRMEKALQQSISLPGIKYNVMGDGQTYFWIKENDAPPTVNWYISGKTTVEGFQNDGRDLATWMFGGSSGSNITVALIDTDSELIIDKMVLFWDISVPGIGDATLLHFTDPLTTNKRLIIANSIIRVDGTTTGAMHFIDSESTDVIIGGCNFLAETQHVTFKTKASIILFANAIEMPLFNPFNTALIEIESGTIALANNNVMSESIETNLTNDLSKTEIYKNTFTDRQIFSYIDYRPIQEEHTINHHEYLVSMVDDRMEDMTTALRTSLDSGMPMDFPSSFDTSHGVPYRIFDIIQEDIYGFQRKNYNNRGDAGAICLSYTLPSNKVIDIFTLSELTNILSPYQHDTTWDEGSLVIPEELKGVLQIRLGANISPTTLFFKEIFMGKHGKIIIEGIQTPIKILSSDIYIAGGKIDIELSNLKIDGRVLLRNTMYDSSFRMFSNVEVDQD